MITKNLIKGYAIKIPDEDLNMLSENELRNIKSVQDFESYHYYGLEYSKIHVEKFIFADTNYNITNSIYQITNSLEQLESELKQRFKDIDIYKNAIFFAGVPKS